MAERDSLAAQVAMLDDLLTQLWRADAVPNALLEDVEVALADTEAAATAWLEAHDREQWLAGAREAMRELRHLLAEHVGSDFRHSRIKDSYDADVAAVLGVMEREASA